MPKLSPEERRQKDLTNKIKVLFERRNGHISTIKRSVTALADIDTKLRRYRYTLQQSQIKLTEAEAQQMFEALLQQI